MANINKYRVIRMEEVSIMCFPICVCARARDVCKWHYKHVCALGVCIVFGSARQFTLLTIATPTPLPLLLAPPAAVLWRR